MTSALRTRQMPLALGGVGDGQSPGSEVPRQCLMTQHPMPSPFHAAWLLSMEGQGTGLRELQGQEPRSSAQQGQDGKVGSWTAEDSGAGILPSGTGHLQDLMDRSENTASGGPTDLTLPFAQPT